MARLEELRPNALVQGIIPGTAVTVVSVQNFGPDVFEVTYKTPEGNLGQQLLTAMPRLA